MKMDPTVCPCCMRVIQEKHRPSFEDCFLRTLRADEREPKRMKECNQRDVIDLLKGSKLSKASRNKLLTFLLNRESSLIDGRPVYGQDVVSWPAMSAVGESPLGGEFSFLSKKPNHRVNFYTDSSMHPSETSNFYQNRFSIEVSNLAKVFETVEQCPWYWGSLSNAEANKLLRDSPKGCFILRNSSDKRYLFSLTTVTALGISSIRIVHSAGSFQFETDNEGQRRRSSNSYFNDPANNEEKCVVNMILQFTELLNNDTTSSVLDSSAPRSGFSETDRNTVRRTKSGTEKFICSLKNAGVQQKFQIHLKHPKYRKIPSLKELSRFAINKKFSLWQAPSQIDSLCLPFKLKSYLNMYPYPV